MRVMVLVKATASSEEGLKFSPEEMAMMEAMGRFNEELLAAGVLEAGEGLHPTSRGRRIAFDGAERRVIDGPFTPAGEQVAGFWIWKVGDMDEAVRWARRCPNPMPGPSEIEIRPIYETEEFALSPELAAQEERMRMRLASA
jgi:hypothetical protein